MGLLTVPTLRCCRVNRDRPWPRGALRVTAPCCQGGGHGNDFGTENTDLFPVLVWVFSAQLGSTVRAPVLQGP